MLLGGRRSDASSASALATGFGHCKPLLARILCARKIKAGLPQCVKHGSTGQRHAALASNRQTSSRADGSDGRSRPPPMELRTNRNFRLLWSAQIVSEIGDWFYTVAALQPTARFYGQGAIARARVRLKAELIRVRVEAHALFRDLYRGIGYGRHALRALL
jgi:hypothetical protein